MINVWDEAGVLPMAIRMRRNGNVPRDIDDCYGEIMAGIVRMASILLPSEDPRYECHKAEFLQPDVQMAMLCQALKAAETYVDTKEKPRKIVNYLIKTVQNRLRNYVRDTEKRKNLMTILPECEISSDLSDYSETAMSLDGRRIPKDPYCRVTNYNRDF
jgi:hypothetical protein